MRRFRVLTLASCHAVFALHSMHRNRTASSLLIPGDGEFEEWKLDSEKLGDGEVPTGSLFNPGSFGCPVKFKTSFLLYHR